MKSQKSSLNALPMALKAKQLNAPVLSSSLFNSKPDALCTVRTVQPTNVAEERYAANDIKGNNRAI